MPARKSLERQLPGREGLASCSAPGGLHRRALALLLFLCLAHAESPAWAQGWAAGVRVGSSVDSPHTSLHEIYGRGPLPLLPGLTRFGLSLELEASAGRMRAKGDSGLVANVGPVLVARPSGRSVSFELGTRPGYLERYRFDGRNLGGPITFVSHIGAQVTLFGPLAIGYRLQHFSNGFLYDRNPGINLHMLELRGRF